MTFKKSIAAIASLASVAAFSIPAYATDFFESSESTLNGPNLEITANYDSKIEMPLSLEASSEVFYCNANLAPGDIAKSTVVMKNVSDQPISVSITEIENMLPEDTKANMLLDILNLTIDVDGEEFYQGKHSELSAPFMPYVKIEPGKEINLNITMSFPREADNRYQGAKYKMKWSFDAIAEEPPVETTPPPPEPVKEPEPAKTGVESSPNSRNIIAPIAMGLIGTVSGLTVYFHKKKN